MRSAVRIALTGALVCSGLLGCRNRVAEERDALWRQSREQQEELDRRNAELERVRQEQMMARNTAQAPTPAPAPAPVVTPPPAPAPAPAPVAPRLAPQPIDESVEVSEDRAAGTQTIKLPGDFFFDSGANTIRGAARTSLDKVAAALLKGQYAGKDVRVEGHTDSDPIRKSKWGSNQALSVARADAVRDYLVKKGVPANLITTAGHGADKPLGADKSRNRRVEIVVLVDPETAARGSRSGAASPARGNVDNGNLNK